jgi:hypothetical protein
MPDFSIVQHSGLTFWYVISVKSAKERVRHRAGPGFFGIPILREGSTIHKWKYDLHDRDCEHQIKRRVNGDRLLSSKTQYG